MTNRTREIHLASRPMGMPSHDNFAVVEAELPLLGEGDLLVRNVFMSVDPYMRPRMNESGRLHRLLDAKSYVPPFRLGKPLDGGALGEVVKSNANGISEGDLVVHGLGWREHAVVAGKSARRVDRIPDLSPSLYLGALGWPGLTAYAGLLDVAQFKPGDTVFVSGAAGAVGGLVGQIARMRGAKRVIGSAGSTAKVAYVTERLGFDAAFNYRDGKVHQQLADAAPNGIDVYFDNVGGDHLEAAIEVLNRNGRVALCGAISTYNQTVAAPGPSNLWLAVGKRLLLRGFMVTDHSGRFGDMADEVGGWLRRGDIIAEETVLEGLENSIDAFLGLFHGDNIGKMIVRLG